MVWSARERRWEIGFQHLQRYIVEHGAAPPAGYRTVDGFRLGAWVNTQRMMRTRKQLTDTQAFRLEKAGLNWRDDRWERAIAALAEYRAAHGHVVVPYDFVTSDGLRLGAWVATRREGARKGRPLSNERVAELNELGMAWDALTAKWEIGLAALRAYTTVSQSPRRKSCPPLLPSSATWPRNPSCTTRTRENKPFVSCRFNRWIQDDQGEWVNDEPTAHNVKVFGSVATHVHDSCGSGDPIFVHGLERAASWPDKATGEKRTKDVVVVDNRFVDNRFGEVGVSLRYVSARVERTRTAQAS